MIGDYLSQLVYLVDLTTGLIFLIIMYVTWKFYEGYNLPPGPWGLPLLGYLPFMGFGPPEVTFNELSKKYGPIMSVYFGSYLIVVINSYELIQDAYVKQGQNFAGRPLSNFLKIEDTDSGIIVTDGEVWREHRRFILSTFKDYGMGKLSLEPKIQEEIHFFLNELAKKSGRPFDLSGILGMSTANIISALELGKRFDYKDERFYQLRNLQEEVVDLFSNKNPRPFFPWMDKVPFSDRITHIKRMRQISRDTRQFIKDMTQEHLADYQENSRKDLIDAYITERNSCISKNGEDGYFNNQEIECTLMGLFTAGTETTTTTLRWGLLYMMLYPEIQKKIQKEIEEVIGMEREPTMSDRSQMVYTDAVLLEIQRCGSLVPLNAPHSNIEEATLNGYRIPKRSVIMTNIWAVHNDPLLWDQPEKFWPERFINEEGKIEKPEYLIPFGIGKRSCVGESLAKMEIFLYFTSMLQRFVFTPPDGATLNLDFETAFTRRPNPYKLCATQRPGYSV